MQVGEYKTQTLIFANILHGRMTHTSIASFQPTLLLRLYFVPEGTHNRDLLACPSKNKKS